MLYLDYTVPFTESILRSDIRTFLQGITSYEELYEMRQQADLAARTNTRMEAARANLWVQRINQRMVEVAPPPEPLEESPMQPRRGNMRINTRATSAMTPDTRARTKSFFIRALNGEDGDFPIQGLVLYVNGQGHPVLNGHYQVADRKVFVGTWYRGEDFRNGVLRRDEALAVLGALIALTGFAQDPEVSEAFSVAVGKMLHGTLLSTIGGYIEGTDSPVTSVEMAFSPRGIAARVDGEWRNPQGALVDITEEGWTIVQQ